VSYLIQLGPVTYEPKGGGTFTLTEALSQVLGVRNARILREDGTVAVEDAGSSYAVTHVTPEGRRRRVRRRLTRRALAEQEALAARRKR
jgi:hypothetical protein